MDIVFANQHQGRQGWGGEHLAHRLYEILWSGPAKWDSKFNKSKQANFQIDNFVGPATDAVNTQVAPGRGNVPHPGEEMHLLALGSVHPWSRVSISEASIFAMGNLATRIPG